MVNPSDEEGEIPTAGDPAESLATHARRESAALERRRRDAIGQRAVESRSITATLVGALDRHAVIHAHGWSEPLTGTVVAVGADVVELPVGTTNWFVSIDSIDAVGVSAGASVGDPGERSSTSIADVITDLADEELPVVLVLTSGQRIGGTPVAHGETLVMSGNDDTAIVVELSAIAGLGVRRR